MFRRLAERCFGRLLGRRPATLIETVARFVTRERVEGDYLEFGVYRGDSLIRAWRAFEREFERRMAESIPGADDEEARRERRRIRDERRFVAFDSFEGLPELLPEDRGTANFTRGLYPCSRAEFESNLRAHGLPLERVVVVPGWFEKTCTPETAATLGLRKAAVVYVDGDLYSSAKTALGFVTPLVQDGTVVIFDDWYSYKGNPARGEQRAFREWVESQKIKDRFILTEYRKEDWNRNSLIVSEKT